MMQNRVVAISGGFDPIHKGHIRYIKEASLLGGRLVVILNGDSFLMRKKGYAFLSAEERKEILESIKGVDQVYIYESDRDDVCGALEALRPDIFAKGGDRRPDGVPIPEEKICDELGIEIVYGVGGNDKPNSSSWIVNNIIEKMRAKA